jgi:hypothetical protein
MEVGRSTSVHERPRFHCGTHPEVSTGVPQDLAREEEGGELASLSRCDPRDAVAPLPQTLEIAPAGLESYVVAIGARLKIADRVHRLVREDCRTRDALTALWMEARIQGGR